MAKLSSYLRGSTTTTGINTSSNLVINSGSATGTASQNLQVIGGAYVSSNTGIGTTNPQAPLHVVGTGATTLFVNGNARITGILSIGQGTLTIDGDGGTVTGLSTITGSTNYSKPNLAGISSTISSTAVDIFVYDTRKDSDGGQWRKRTQHTSWYNETLNTATRGSRRDFPAVAVIVATTSSVTIYDGDDPDMPMWMVFNSGAYTAFTSSTISGNASLVYPISLTSIFALNGTLAIGASNYQVYLPNFISDVNVLQIAAFGDYTGGFALYSQPISGRNSSGVYVRYSTQEILESGINDVAMTVLPNAPIDSATGLPIPTIAVATDGGVSIIKDDGAVVDIIDSNAGYRKNLQVKFTTDNKLVYTETSAASEYGWMYIHEIPQSDETITINTKDTALGWYDTRTQSYMQDVLGVTIDASINVDRNIGLNVGIGTIIPNIVTGNKHIFVAPARNSGITIIEENRSATNSGLVAYATTSYNTGWMHGNIKGAWLSDTSTASVTGTELVTNGTFDSNVSGWTAVNATIAYSSGRALVTRTGGSGPSAYQTITTVIGQRYVLSGTIDSTGTGNRGDIRAYSDAASTLLVSAPGTDNQTVNVLATFTATTTTTYIYFTLDDQGTGYFDNVSVRLAEPDRSANNKGLAVYGTITKSVVATGSNLVAYSGFSNNTNFLRQPYNSGLDFGTGNFSTICWFKMSDISQTGFIFDRANVSSEGNRMSLYTENSYLKFYTYDGTASEEQCILTGLSNTWINVVAIRNSSGVMELYLNGQLKSSTSRVIKNVTNTTASTTIGARYTGATNSFPGSISLLRISASIPSPTQIAKIYNDEKALFQPNSQCTLYGSSDAVTALAYDDTTKLLSVGTSSGRSDFQGLERINNTTTAVTTAISASNGLIAEQ